MQDNDQDKHDKAVTDLYAELSREQPSAALDEKILNQAHKAVEPGRNTGPFSASWMLPVSMAAVIVLSVVLVTLVEQEHPEIATEISEPTGILKEGISTDVSPSSEAASSGVLSQEKSSSPEKPLSPEKKSSEKDTAESLPVVAKNKSELEKLANDGDKAESGSVMSSGAAADEEGVVKSPANTGEKKKVLEALARPVQPSRQRNLPSATKEQEFANKALSDETHQRRIRLSMDVEPAARLDARKAQQLGGDIAASSTDRSFGDSVDQQKQQDESEPASYAASPSSVEFQALGKSAVGSMDPTACKLLNDSNCLKSSACTLIKSEQTGQYVCRAADNKCEEGFIQSDHQKSDCEAKPGCTFLPADCYCAPKQTCQCRDGVPPRCAPTSKTGKP